MNDIKIDSNVAIPATRRGRTKYPFATMNVGDSFFSPEENARTAALQHARNANAKGSCVKFVTRSVTESGETGYRIWRTE
jgi:hypothetical protein